MLLKAPRVSSALPKLWIWKLLLIVAPALMLPKLIGAAWLSPMKTPSRLIAISGPLALSTRPVSAKLKGLSSPSLLKNSKVAP